jgi:hypothetical protein
MDGALFDEFLGKNLPKCRQRKFLKTKIFNFFFPKSNFVLGEGVATFMCTSYNLIIS